LVGAEEEPQDGSNWIDGNNTEEDDENMGGVGDDKDDASNDAEGVWAADIEQAFQEALAIYPPCGRRKIILSDEGKMYGRNELIARYIKLRTGKSRTRKQVSSHIQVLARKKARELQGKLKDQHMKDKALGALANMSSAQIVSSLALHHRPPVLGTPGIAGPGIPMHTMLTSPNAPSTPVLVKQEMAPHLGSSPHMLFQQPQAVTSSGLLTHGPTYFPFPPSGPILVTPTSTTFEPVTSGPFVNPAQVSENTPQNIAAKGTVISNLPLKMMEFTAFVEKQGAGENADASQRHVFVSISPNEDFFKQGTQLETVELCHIADKFPEKSGGLKDLFEKGPQARFFLVKFWADLTSPLLDDQTAFYGVTSQFESTENVTITCSTKVCSFGKQVVEKVETEYSRYDGGRFVYRINRSPMCEYMISFIHRLKHLPEKFMMNSVLDNFTILQVVTNRETQEVLLCLAYIFEVSSERSGSKHRIYRLVKNAS
jgi:transcriptional enhancer factor